MQKNKQLWTREGVVVRRMKLYCRAGQLALVSGKRLRSTLVPRKDRARCLSRVRSSERTAAMKFSSALLGLLTCGALAMTMPRPASWPEEVEPQLKVSGNRTYWEARFPCVCKAGGTAREQQFVGANASNDEALAKLYDKIEAKHGPGKCVFDECSMDIDDEEGGGEIANAAAAGQMAGKTRPREGDDVERPRCTATKRLRFLADEQSPVRDQNGWALKLRRDYDANTKTPAAGATAPPPVTVGTETPAAVATAPPPVTMGTALATPATCGCCGDLKNKNTTLEAQLAETNAKLAETETELAGKIPDLAEVQADYAEPLEQRQRPGAGWAHTVDKLPPRTKGNAHRGLALLNELTAAAESESDDDDGGGGVESNAAAPAPTAVEPPKLARPRRARATGAVNYTHQPDSGPGSENFRKLENFRKKPWRGAQSVEVALFVAGAGDKEMTAAILDKVNERASNIGLGGKRADWRLLRRLPETIRGYFDLSPLPKGGTRRTYEQQKLDAVLEPVTPPDAKEQGLLHSVLRLVGLQGGTPHQTVAKAAERRQAQEKNGRLFPHRERELRRDCVDLACARAFWHECEEVRLDTFAGRVDKKVKFTAVETDAEGRRRLVVKTEYHQRHTKHADDKVIYATFLQSPIYAEHLKAHPSHKIGFSTFMRAKCPCIGTPHQRECADETKTTMRELLAAHHRLRLKVHESKRACECDVCMAAKREAVALTALDEALDTAAAAAAVAAAAATAETRAAAEAADSRVAAAAVALAQLRALPEFLAVTADASCYKFTKAVLCPQKRQRDLEIVDNEEVRIHDKECSYGECQHCGVSSCSVLKSRVLVNC